MPRLPSSRPRAAIRCRSPNITPQQGFNLNGAAEWDRYRTEFRETTKQAAE